MIKVKTWQNVHHDIETCESGRYYAMGDSYMYDFYEVWLYILWIPLIRVYFNSKQLYKYS